MRKKILILFSVLLLVMTSSQTFADLGSAMTKDAVYKRGHGAHFGKGWGRDWNKGKGWHRHKHWHWGWWWSHITPPGQCRKNPSAC